MKVFLERLHIFTKRLETEGRSQLRHSSTHSSAQEAMSLGIAKSVPKGHARLTPRSTAFASTNKSLRQQCSSAFITASQMPYGVCAPINHLIQVKCRPCEEGLPPPSPSSREIRRQQKHQQEPRAQNSLCGDLFLYRPRKGTRSANRAIDSLPPLRSNHPKHRRQQPLRSCSRSPRLPTMC